MLYSRAVGTRFMPRPSFSFSVRSLTVVWLLCSCFALAQSPGIAPPSKTVWTGVYTAAQATRGQAFYTAACTGCHRDDLSGPFSEVLKGERFMNNWREQSLLNLYNLMATTMPQLSPGSLEPAAYADIIAYILQFNGFPAGSAELRVGGLRGVLVTGKEGPGQMPDGALITVVGCLAHTVSGSWAVVHAPDPFRTMNPVKPSAADLKAAESSPLGTREFHLTSTDFFQPDRHLGKKVEARGFLTSREDGPLINLTALTAVAPTCAR
jgi:mono/diheme cytochrome c family protein